MENEILNTVSGMGWPATAAVLGTVLAILGFAVTLAKLYYDHKKKEGAAGWLDLGDIPGRMTAVESDIDRIKHQIKNSDMVKVREHSEEIVKIRHGIATLKQELDHIKESFTDKDQQAMLQIEEMKRALDKFTDMLIRMISSGS